MKKKSEKCSKFNLTFGVILTYLKEIFLRFKNLKVRHITLYTMSLKNCLTVALSNTYL